MYVLLHTVCNIGLFDVKTLMISMDFDDKRAKI